ncbi:hypothetical protein V1290_003232 [Bradyrhizobium sp. AZCC 1578]
MTFAYPPLEGEGKKPRSQHLMHVDDDAVGVAGGGGDEEVLHQPAIFSAPVSNFGTVRK